MRSHLIGYHRKHSTRQYRYAPGKQSHSYAMRPALLVLCLIGLVYSGLKVYRFFAGSWQTRLTNEAAAALYHSKEAAETTPAYTMRQGVTGVPLAAPTPAPATVFQKIGESPLPRFQALLKANPDVIGWLNIRGELDLPVVYRDNEYYLTRDVYRKKSSSGTLFLDENHPLAASAQYLVIHGHNMKDGSMFGRLQRYLEIGYLQKHCAIQFDTLYQESTYMVFAVLVVPENVHSAGYINFLGYPAFSSPDQLLEFVNGLKDKSKFAIPIKVEASDVLLTLSTCYGEDRLIIAARRVRPGESASSLKMMVGYALKK
jgi:sortase B